MIRKLKPIRELPVFELQYVGKTEFVRLASVRTRFCAKLFNKRSLFLPNLLDAQEWLAKLDYVQITDTGATSHGIYAWKHDTIPNMIGDLPY